MTYKGIQEGQPTDRQQDASIGVVWLKRTDLLPGLMLTAT